MPATYQEIYNQTLTSAASSVNFSLIPSTYTDLILVTTTFGSRAAQADSLAIRFNGDTGSNYSYTSMYGDASGAASTRSSNQTNIWCGNFSSNSVANPSPIIIQIQNYSNSTTFKTVLSRQNAIAGTGYTITGANVGLWRSTSAINSITLRSETGNNFSVGSTFALYGIAAA